MNRCTTGMAIVLAAVAQAACVNAPTDVGAKAPLQLMSGPPVTCPNATNNSGSGPQHYCNVQIQLALAGNVCTATTNSPVTFPNTVNSSTDNKQLIVWQLVPPAGVTGVTFAFPAANGVIITSGPSAHPQLAVPTPGDGMSNNSVSYYHTYNKQNFVDGPNGSTYFPVVIMTDASGNQSTCAALDPRIINTN